MIELARPLVTIAIAVRNGMPTVRDALSSSFAQTYEPKEVVAADGLSTDGTLEELKKWPLRDVFSDGGAGLARARQLLLQAARGKYVLWVDADHVLPTDFLEKQVAFAEANPDLGAVEAIVYPLDGGAAGFTEGLTRLVLTWRRAKRGKSLPASGTPVTLFRKEAAMGAGGFDPRFTTAGEDSMITRAMRAKGWRFAVNPNAWAYHAGRSSWAELWREYYNWGRAARRVAAAYPGTVSAWKSFPAVALVSGLLNAARAAKLSASAYSFLIPVHSLYKRAAWSYGYLKEKPSIKRELS
ncbi:MAG: glycosyltransferase [Thermoprotei archaeon]